MTERAVRRRNRPNLHSDEVLLGAAADVFYRRGYHEASMAEMAAEAGATKPTLYARFGGKEALYDRVMQRIAESLISAIAKAYEDVDEQDDAETAAAYPVVAFHQWVKADPVGFHLLFTDARAPTGIEHRNRAITELEALMADVTAQYLRRRGLRSGRMTRLLVAYAVGVMQEGARWAAENDPTGRFDLDALSTAFILHGLQGTDPDTLAALRARAEGIADPRS